MMRTWKSRLLILLTWVSATGAFGTCNFFKPADAPTGTPVTPDYSTPDRTLATMAAGIADKNLTNGQQVYIHAFSDLTRDGSLFQAGFDAADMAAHPRWDRKWKREQEQTFYKTLVARNPWPYELTWERYEPNGNDTDSLLHRKYTINLVISGRKLLYFVGAADLYFTRSAGADTEWVIKQWNDFRTVESNSTDNTTLGYMRLDRAGTTGQ